MGVALKGGSIRKASAAIQFDRREQLVGNFRQSHVHGFNRKLLGATHAINKFIDVFLQGKSIKRVPLDTLVVSNAVRNLFPLLGPN